MFKKSSQKMQFFQKIIWEISIFPDFRFWDAKSFLEEKRAKRFLDVCLSEKKFRKSRKNWEKMSHSIHTDSSKEKTQRSGASLIDFRSAPHRHSAGDHE